MRLIEIKLRNLSKKLMFSCFSVLMFCALISITQTHAQDIPNTEEIKSVIAAPERKKAAKAVKPKDIKPKFTPVSLRKNAPVAKSKPKNTTKQTDSESYSVIPLSKNDSKIGVIAAVSGIVRLKQLNQAAAGVLIEAIRVDTREMIDSAETNAAGEYKFNKLPSGVALVFLISSPKTKPLIFQTAVETGMKNLDFTVFPK